MTSQRPYLIRAIYEWILDNQLTPYILVDASHEGAQVPQDYINNGKIVLNIAPEAVSNFHVDNEWISFSARFSGKPMEIFAPIPAVLGIYCKENNEGMFFSDPETTPPTTPDKPSENNNKKSGLRVVK